jgi:chaperonin GroES
MENKSGLTVTGDKILVLLMKVEEKTMGGILLPQASQDKEQMAQQMGTLVQCGEIASKAPQMQGIEVGDTVLIARYAGQHFPVDGQNYWIMRATDVLGKATKLPDYMIRGAEASHEVFGVNMPDNMPQAA